MELTTSRPAAVLPRFGAAPAAAAARPVAPGAGAPERPAPTTRRLWLVLYGLIAVLTALRAPAAYDDLQRSIPADISAGIGDPQMQQLALRIGTILAVVVYLFAIGVYLSLAALLEKRVFGVGLSLGGGRSAGLFFLLAVLCTVPVAAYGLVSGDLHTTGGLLHATWFVLVGLLTPLLFLPTLRTLPRGRLAVLYAVVALMVGLIGVSS